MNNITLLLFLFISSALCAQNGSSKYLVISYDAGENPKPTMLTKALKNGEQNTIFKPEGSLQDTLYLTPEQEGVYTLITKKGGTGKVLLLNGTDVTFTTQGEFLNRTYIFNGDSQMVVDNTVLNEEYNSISPILGNMAMNLDKKSRQDIERSLDSVFKVSSDNLNGSNEISTDLKRYWKEDLEMKKKGLLKLFDKNLEASIKLAKGKKAPKFEDFVNHRGGTTSLSDFKGKYVFIDLWATWCKPCIAQIPYIEKLQEKYKDHNIEFVSISIDEDADKWRKMVTEKELSGIHLLSGNGFENDFLKSFNGSGVPLFILIDPEGNIVERNAPQPSDPKLIELFEENKI